MKRILIVDDEPHVRRILALTLEREGYEVEWAENGLVALERIRLARPDLMITDIIMPLMGGRDLCREIRRNGVGEAFPIWVMTSKPERDAKEWVKEFPDLEVMEKPLSSRQLLRRVTSLFAGEGHADAGEG